MHSEIATLGTRFQVASWGEAGLGQSFNVSSIEHVGRPLASEIFNEFDEAGLLLVLKRLPGEKNAAYKRRLFDVFRRRANATYKGLLYGITRELGLELFSPFRIAILRTAGMPNGRNPVIEFDGPEVRVWADRLVDSTPELTLDRFDMSIAQLVTAINVSIYISATVPIATIGLERAMQIADQSSLVHVSSELLTDSVVNVLENRNLVAGSLFFSGTTAYTTRVGTPEAVTAPGRYFLDRTSGTLISFESPGPVAAIRYQYLVDPLEVVASPIILHNIQGTTFKRKMFERVLLEDGTTALGLPTPLGTDLINELLSVKGTLYGK